MELEIRRRESTGSGPNTYVETETLAKFELMDGAPVRGITIFPLNFFFKRRHHIQENLLSLIQLITV